MVEFGTGLDLLRWSEPWRGIAGQGTQWWSAAGPGLVW